MHTSAKFKGHAKNDRTFCRKEKATYDFDEVIYINLYGTDMCQSKRTILLEGRKAFSYVLGCYRN